MKGGAPAVRYAPLTLQNFLQRNDQRIVVILIPYCQTDITAAFKTLLRRQIFDKDTVVFQELHGQLFSLYGSGQPAEDVVCLTRKYGQRRYLFQPLGNTAPFICNRIAGGCIGLVVLVVNLQKVFA